MKSRHTFNPYDLSPGERDLLTIHDVLAYLDAEVDEEAIVFADPYVLSWTCPDCGRRVRTEQAFLRDSWQTPLLPNCPYCD